MKGVDPKEVAALFKEMQKDSAAGKREGAHPLKAILAEKPTTPVVDDRSFDLEHRLAGFRAVVAHHKSNFAHLEELDGSWKTWRDLSEGGKLNQMAWDAAVFDVPLKPFAEAVVNAIGDVAEATLQVVLHNAKELYGIARLLPDNGRLEHTPLIEQVRELVEHVRKQDDREPTKEHDHGIER